MSFENDNKRVCVCVDAAGGDRPVSCVLEGVALALQADENLEVVVTGPEQEVVPFAQAHERCRACATTQVIGMDEHPVQAVRSKPDSSIVVGCKLVRQGEADGFFSAGSTGAVMTAAVLGIGRIKGIDRPALTAVLPGPKPTVFLDLGANADCKVENLVQFAQMGVAYAGIALGLENPTAALLNNGSEDTKGSMFAQECHARLMQQVPQFAGNAEGTDLLAGHFDVIVTDGFTGNTVLKSIEGMSKFLLGTIVGAAKADAALAPALGAFKPVLAQAKDALSGDKYGGAILLGVKGVVAIGHGATSPEAVMNGTLCVAQAARAGLVAKIAANCGC
jgi:phosphate acyltransferase